MWGLTKRKTFICQTIMLLTIMVSYPAMAACVSAIPQTTPNSQLVDNDNGTITDTATGLIWKKCSEGQNNDTACTGSATWFTWDKALQAAETLNSSGGFAGKTDWRLPNIKELLSLVEEACSHPSINSVRFPNTEASTFTASSRFWSASAGAGNSTSAWDVSFYDGYSNYNSRKSSYRVRLVRGGQ
jgi:hypothetical protein